MRAVLILLISSVTGQSCREFQPGLCTGSSDCMCATSDACNADSGGTADALHKLEGRGPPQECPGDCRKVVHGQCAGSASCLLDAGPCDQCPTTTIATVGSVAVRRLIGDAHAFFWKHSLACDADGAPNAYNANDTGIDYLANAGHPGNWWGIATDSSGTPYVQGSHPAGSAAPYPGFYVSTTSLEDGAFPTYDVRRYTNAVKVSFIVLPEGSFMSKVGARLGDACFVYSEITGRHGFAILADTGPADQIGEGSVALHLALGHNPYNDHHRVASSIDSGVHVLCFAGSSDGPQSSQAAVDALGWKAFRTWGGMERFDKCVH